MLQTFKKYGLVNELTNSIQTNQFKSMSYYKRMVKQIVYEREIVCFRASLFLYRDLELLRKSVNRIIMHAWWKFQSENPTWFRPVSSVVALLIGVQPYNFQCNIDKKFCQLCSLRCKDDNKHILMGCVNLAQVRYKYFSEVKDAMPIAMKNALTEMNIDDQLYFIVSGLQCDYNKKWSNIYKAIAKFVCEIYRKRKLL